MKYISLFLRLWLLCNIFIYKYIFLSDNILIPYLQRTNYERSESTNSNLNLLNYLSSYLGEKVFTCERCHKGFRQKRDLQRHVLTHTGEKPFACKICGRGFSRKDKLSIHVRSHNKQKVCCEVCNTSYDELQTLQRHTAAVHNIDLSIKTELKQ